MKNFISSDIHGFFPEYYQSLQQAGFDINNPNHRIIICGDLFDRGKQSKELLEFLLNIPKDRLILIRGNHEDLMDDCLKDIKARTGIHRHHILNGTLDTIVQLTNISEWDIRCNIYNYNIIIDKLSSYYKLISQCVDYFEIDHKIFVHGWIPLNDDLKFSYNPNWRQATKEEWGKARWYNGMDMNHLKLQDEHDIIYCGHWHTSYGHSVYHNEGKEFGDDANFNPYYDKGIVALDGCTAYSHHVNVVVLDDSGGCK